MEGIDFEAFLIFNKEGMKDCDRLGNQKLPKYRRLSLISSNFTINKLSSSWKLAMFIFEDFKYNEKKHSA